MTSAQKMKCDGCNRAMKGIRFRCLQCTDLVYCTRCQGGGIHSHHTIVQVTSGATGRALNLPLSSAFAATRTVAAFVVPDVIPESPRSPGDEVSFGPESRERQGSVDYVKTTNFTKRGSTASLPYDMFPSAAPPIVQPSTLKRQNVKTSPKETQRLSTASLPYDIFPTVAPPIVQPSTNTSFINAKPSPATSSQSLSDRMEPVNGPGCIAPVVPPRRSPSLGSAVSSSSLNLTSDTDDYISKWVPGKSSISYRRVELPESDPEFKAVIQNMAQKGGEEFISNVDKICRIENYRLYKTYRSCREHMTWVNDTETFNERILWHGTSADVLGNIYRDGFNRSYCGRNATAYGNGVYFAESFEYSASPTYSPPDTKGQKFIFQCRVLTGHFTQGKQGLKEPPLRTAEFRFDSVVDNMSQPTMFVVFKDMQVYPEYIITLKL